MFRKAVPFSPIMDVAGFISEFVCDVEHRLDIEDMRENIRHYRRLEAELGYIQRKVDALEKICKQAEAVEVIKERLRVNEFLLDRARVAELEHTLQRMDEEIARDEARLQELIGVLERDDARLKQLRAQRDTWREEQARSDVFTTKQRLEDQQKLLETEYLAIRQSLQRQERLLLEVSSRWMATLADVRGSVSWFDHSPDGAALVAAHREFGNVGAALERACACINDAMRQLRKPYDLQGQGLLNLDVRACEVDLAGFEEAALRFSEASEDLQTIRRAIESALAAWREESKELQQVIAELKKGIKPYEPKVTSLQQVIADALREQTGEFVPVTIFAEALDIPNPTWHRAIEGYLHTQRFYLLVPPEHFQRALEVYDRVKRERRIYDVGLVDVGRILARKPDRLPGSLAEEVETDNPYARAYADYLLGRVMKCERVQDLRKHHTAITPDGMLYQNYVARQLDPKRWESLFIGKRALAQQLEQKTARLAEVDRHVETWTERGRRASGWARTAPLSEGDLRDVREAQEALMRIPPMQKELQRVIAELGALDLSYLLDLEKKIEHCEAQISEVEKHRDVVLREQAQVAEHVRRIAEERRPAVEAERAEAAGKIRNDYDEAFVSEQGNRNFSKSWRVYNRLLRYWRILVGRCRRTSPDDKVSSRNWCHCARTTTATFRLDSIFSGKTTKRMPRN
ncbi:hypothetical protein GCM10025857_12500 [Alicyclobacillus contaminans]|nr:hypothetical protein GCM10025857_12500 [Alicyclobacillus contaminans]